MLNFEYETHVLLQALNCIGLRVVLDVVYNHLHGSGPFDENSVLDKVMVDLLLLILLFLSST